MDSVSDFLKRAATQTGFERVRFAEKNLPADYSNILVVPFFGDLSSTFVLSSFILKRIKETRPNKYLILASWPGYEAMFPYVDEYWSPKDATSLSQLVLGAEDFRNVSDLSTSYVRSLNTRFEDVFMPEDIRDYYYQGFGKKFWDEFKDIKRYFPSVLSASRINQQFKADLQRRVGNKIVVFPARKVRSWQRGKVEYVMVQKEFWVTLVKRLLEEGFTPVLFQNTFTHDLSVDFAEKCSYLVSNNMEEVLASLRYVGCVLDFFTGISRISIAARCPFVMVDERVRYIEEKSYEIDDLCCQAIPKQYIFCFSTFIMSGTVADWNSSIIDNVVARLNKFLPNLDRDTWESTTESETSVSYDNIRERKAKRLGMNFIRKY